MIFRNVLTIELNNSYYRMLIHRLARFYGLSHQTFYKMKNMIIIEKEVENTEMYIQIHNLYHLRPIITFEDLTRPSFVVHELENTQMNDSFDDTSKIDNDDDSSSKLEKSIIPKRILKRNVDSSKFSHHHHVESSSITTTFDDDNNNQKKTRPFSSNDINNNNVNDDNTRNKEEEYKKARDRIFKDFNKDSLEDDSIYLNVREPIYNPTPPLIYSSDSSNILNADAPEFIPCEHESASIIEYHHLPLSQLPMTETASNKINLLGHILQISNIPIDSKARMTIKDQLYQKYKAKLRIHSSSNKGLLIMSSVQDTEEISNAKLNDGLIIEAWKPEYFPESFRA